MIIGDQGHAPQNITHNKQQHMEIYYRPGVIGMLKNQGTGIYSACQPAKTLINGIITSVRSLIGTKYVSPQIRSFHIVIIIDTA